MDNSFESPAVISFCPGILGIERGLARAGVECRVAAYVEIEAYIIANLVAGMEAGVLGAAPIWTDAKTFDAQPFRGRIHGIIGGYPCTPFSLAGNRSGEEHAGHIYPFISKAIEAARPVWCFFENVDDHLTLGFNQVYKDLSAMGYNVEAGVYTAAETGAPHERQRLFILAILGNAGSEYLGISIHEQRQKRKGANKNPNAIWTDKTLVNAESEQCVWELGEQKTRNAGFANTSEKLAYTNSSRFQEQRLNGKQIKTKDNRISNASTTQWPAGQGSEQYEWEEPRTIESGMGCTIDGYNFREDLLRALGNSVVEQTAEIAFIDLMNKHLKNSTPRE